MGTWLLFPGWSFTPETLLPFIRKLEASGEGVVPVDLQPDLERALAPERTLDRTVLSLADRLEGPAVWCGWSLGGLFVLRATQLVPERVERAILLASSPRPIAEERWPGIAREALAELYRLTGRDPRRAVRRFELMTAKGDTPLLRRLARRPLWSRTALLRGLELLEALDLRSEWQRTERCLLFWAKQERLFPSDLLPALRALNRAVPIRSVEGHHLFPLTPPESLFRLAKDGQRGSSPSQNLFDHGRSPRDRS